jgi:hypothetical protein
MAPESFNDLVAAASQFHGCRQRASSAAPHLAKPVWRKLGRTRMWHVITLSVITSCAAGFFSRLAYSNTLFSLELPSSEEPRLRDFLSRGRPGRRAVTGRPSEPSASR